MRRFIHIVLMCIFFICGYRAQVENKLVEKHFVKEKRILFRILPKNKEVFNDLKTNALKITRYTINEGGNLNNEVVVNNMLIAYYEADTLNWMKLFRKDKNKTGFIYNALCQNKTNEKISLQDKQKFEKMTFDLMLLACDFDKEIAKACGLFFIDSTIINNQKYVYKLATYTNSLSLKTTELLSVKIDADELSFNKKITDLKGKSKNKIATIYWKATNYSSDYSGYNIYRSEDSLKWNKVNSSPVILLSTQFEKNKQFIYYNDTLPQSKKKYFYALRGINFFGEESELSNILTLYSAPVIKSIPIIDSINVFQNKVVNLKWRMENNLETPLPEKYILLRSEKVNGAYKIIYETKNNLNFSDKNPLQSNYYKVGAITYNYDTLFSFARLSNIIDTIAPNLVNNIKARVEKNGQVTLTWDKSKDADCLGYKVFKSNRLQDEFVQVNKMYIKDTFYIEKLNLKTLSKKIFYKIAVSDKNHNTSVFSEAIEVKRPDTIPPSAPIITSVNQKFNGLYINFILSKSNDVQDQLLLRKDPNNAEFKEVFKFNKNDSTGIVIDSLIELGSNYSYKLKATDEDGNSSYSKELVTLFETGYRKKIKDIVYEVDRTGKTINLTWKYNETNIQKFVIYRSKKDEPLTIIKTVNGNTLQFRDKTVNIGNEYEYRIKAAMQNGTESIISNPIKIEY